MKLRLSSSIFLFALTPIAFATPTPVKSLASFTPGKFYVGALGGLSSSNDFDASQYGTAFFVEAAGGPLSVNAFGELNHRKGAFYGAQIGYQAQEICLSSSQWTLRPAAELEGFAMNRRSVEGDLFNNTQRLPEHDFNVSYPMKKTVFLANAVLNFNAPRLPVHPYIGVGIGNAILKISDANAMQIEPIEVNINHYNSNGNDTDTTFAGQLKLGLSYDILKYITVFAEYRRLYLANSHFVFGSTVEPTHVETSSWQVNLDDQQYNLGNIGVRINW